MQINSLVFYFAAYESKAEVDEENFPAANPPNSQLLSLWILQVSLVKLLTTNPRRIVNNKTQF